MSFTTAEKRDVLLKARIIFQDEVEAQRQQLAQMAPESREAFIAQTSLDVLQGGEAAAKALWLEIGQAVTAGLMA